MKNINIDFSACKYPVDLHSEIREKLGLPEWYGNNLDALWDTITGFIETPIKITVVLNTKGLEHKGTVLLCEIKRTVEGLDCRLGRCFCFAEVSTGHPHPCPTM